MLVHQAHAATLVATVQAASLLPVLFVSLPAGVPADVLDRRRLLLVVEACMAALAAALAALGVGAVAGALTMTRPRGRLSANRLLALFGRVFAGGTVVAAVVPYAGVVVVVMVATGVGWLVVLSTLNTAMQLTLPAWVRARGLSAYLIVFMGGQGVGSLLWGLVAGVATLPLLPMYAQTGTLDRTVAAYWPEPSRVFTPDPGDGPVLVTVAYRVDGPDTDAFLAAVRRLGVSRRRTGAARWSVYRDSERPDTYVEAFEVPSWREHCASTTTGSPASTRGSRTRSGGTRPTSRWFATCGRRRAGEADRSGVPGLDELRQVDPAVAVVVGVREDRVDLLARDGLLPGVHREPELDLGDQPVTVDVEFLERPLEIFGHGRTPPGGGRLRLSMKAHDRRSDPADPAAARADGRIGPRLSGGRDVADHAAAPVAWALGVLHDGVGDDEPGALVEAPRALVRVGVHQGDARIAGGGRPRHDVVYEEVGDAAAARGARHPHAEQHGLAVVGDAARGADRLGSGERHGRDAALRVEHGPPARLVVRALALDGGEERVGLVGEQHEADVAPGAPVAGDQPPQFHPLHPQPPARVRATVLRVQRAEYAPSTWW
jgi:hypothetical protein